MVAAAGHCEFLRHGLVCDLSSFQESPRLGTKDKEGDGLVVFIYFTIGLQPVRGSMRNNKHKTGSDVVFARQRMGLSILVCGDAVQRSKDKIQKSCANSC
jgi:hypothetical protein